MIHPRLQEIRLWTVQSMELVDRSCIFEVLDTNKVNVIMSNHKETERLDS